MFNTVCAEKCKIAFICNIPLESRCVSPPPHHRLYDTITLQSLWCSHDISLWLGSLQLQHRHQLLHCKNASGRDSIEVFCTYFEPQSAPSLRFYCLSSSGGQWPQWSVKRGHSSWSTLVKSFCGVQRCFLKETTIAWHQDKVYYCNTCLWWSGWVIEG